MSEIDRLCAALPKGLGAVKGRALHNEAVTVGGKIAAFISHERLVVKLPQARIAELVAAEVAEPMRMGARAMKEWVSISRAVHERWAAFAEESARYVLIAPPAKKRAR